MGSRTSRLMVQCPGLGNCSGHSISEDTETAGSSVGLCLRSLVKDSSRAQEPGCTQTELQDTGGEGGLSAWTYMWQLKPPGDKVPGEKGTQEEAEKRSLRKPSI